MSADKACLGKDNLAAVVAVGGAPYVPFKNNSTGGKGSDQARVLAAVDER